MRYSPLLQSTCIFFAGLLFVSSVQGAIVYDPVTNTYIDDSIQVVETTITTGTTTTGATQTQFIPIEESDPIISVNDAAVQTSTVNAYATMSVTELESILNRSSGQLLGYLADQEDILDNSYATHVTNIFGGSAVELTSCLGDSTTIQQISLEINALVSDLEMRIQADAAELFSDIAELSYKTDIGLYSQSASNVEGGVLATKIDTFVQNYILLIDHYVRQADESILEFAQSQEADDYELIFEVYLSRKTLLDQVQQAFDNFESSSFVNQTVIGPRADELRTLGTDIFDVFEEDMRYRWGDRAFSLYQPMIDQMRTEYLVYMNNAIDEFFPHTAIQDIYNSYNTLESMYPTSGNGYDCQQVVSNTNVEDIAPRLIDKVQDLQQEIALSNSSINNVTSWADVQTELSQLLLQYYDTYLDAQFTSAWQSAPTQLDYVVSRAVREQGLPVTHVSSLYVGYVDQVTTYLISMRAQYIEIGNLQGFEEKMEMVYNKINTQMASDSIDSGVLLILEAVRQSIIDVLNG